MVLLGPPFRTRSFGRVISAPGWEGATASGRAPGKPRETTSRDGQRGRQLHASLGREVWVEVGGNLVEVVELQIEGIDGCLRP